MGIFIGTSTSIGSSSNDIKRVAKDPSILYKYPLISMDRPGVNMYVDFLVNPEVTVYEMTHILYYNNDFSSDGPFTVDGLNWIAEYPAQGDWYLELKIWVDSVTYHTFVSNTLTI